MMKYFESKLKLVTVPDAGSTVEEFFKTFSCKDGESMKDYILRYDKYMRDGVVLQGLRSVSQRGNV